MTADAPVTEMAELEADGGVAVPAPAAKGAAGRFQTLLGTYGYRILSVMSIVVVLAAWQVCAVTGVVNPTLTSSPWGVVQAGRTLIDQGVLGKDLLASAQLFAVGLVISISIGTIGGILIGSWKVVAALLEPWVAILYAMPLIAVLPLILLWFGITFRSEVIIVVIISVFPVLVSVIAGTRNVDAELIRMAKSFRVKPLHVVRTIVFPSLIAYFVAGVRLAIGFSLIGVVLAEYFLGNKGIGGLIVTSGEQLLAGQVLLGIAILAVASVIMTSLLRYAESRLTHWRGD